MRADVAQQVERILGKDEVTGSNPVISSINRLANASRFFVAWIGVEVCDGEAGAPLFLCDQNDLICWKYDFVSFLISV